MNLVDHLRAKQIDVAGGKPAQRVAGVDDFVEIVIATDDDLEVVLDRVRGMTPTPWAVVTRSGRVITIARGRLPFVVVHAPSGSVSADQRATIDAMTVAGGGPRPEPDHETPKRRRKTKTDETPVEAVDVSDDVEITYEMTDTESE